METWQAPAPEFRARFLAQWASDHPLSFSADTPQRRGLVDRFGRHLDRVPNTGRGAARFTGRLRDWRFPIVRSSTCRTARRSHWGAGVTREEMSEMRWVKPKLVAQIRFVEWTAEGHLRHSAFLGLRTDKRARDVRRET
jgi:hypothetical protein